MRFVFKPVFDAFLMKEMRTVREFNYFLVKLELIPTNRATIFIKTSILNTPSIDYFQIPDRRWLVQRSLIAIGIHPIGYSQRSSPEHKGDDEANDD